MAKNFTPRDLYQEVTDKIIASLERGAAPWIRPWQDDKSGGFMPHNAISGKAYRGINVMLLLASPYASPAWLTYKQAAEHGGNVRKGEKGTMVVLWQFNKRTVKNDDGSETSKTVPLLRSYTVFNIKQCEGVKLPKRRNVVAPVEPTEIDEMINGIGARITYGGNRACYTPSLDLVSMPNRGAFVSMDAYHATLLHELTHWTASPARLASDLSGRFGSASDAAEELIAELGSAFLCAELGVQIEKLQHVDYIADWLRVLKSDKRAIFTAAKHATAAADYLAAAMGRREDAETMAAEAA